MSSVPSRNMKTPAELIVVGSNGEDAESRT